MTTPPLSILTRLRSAESSAAERVKRFADEWRRCHPSNADIYSLNVDSDREAVLHVADLETLFTALEAKENAK